MMAASLKKLTLSYDLYRFHRPTTTFVSNYKLLIFLCYIYVWSLLYRQLSWSYVFGQIERAKHRLDIEDYSVSQTTLEQVFISFARMQRPPQDFPSATCCGCRCGICCRLCRRRKKVERDQDDEESEEMI